MNDILLTIMNLGNGLFIWLAAVPGIDYLVIFLSLVASVVIALVKSILVRKWEIMPSETKMFLTNFATLVVMSVGAYLAQTPNDDPVKAIAALVGVTTAIQQPFFYKVVKPMVANFWEQWEKGSALNAELTSAAVPSSGIPLDK